MKRFVFFMIFFLLTAGICFAKYADLAGSWYTSDSSELRKELTKYLTETKVPKIKGDVIGVISPHAGFRYSGSVAAYSYNILKQKKPSLVILIGFSHKKLYPGKVAAITDEYFSTPLGRIKIDTSFTESLMKDNEDLIIKSPDIFSSENAIEMQIPFIQLTAPDAKLVALALCDQRKSNCDKLSEILFEKLKTRSDYILISSSDMCHYLTYNNARIRDSHTIDIIKDFDSTAFYMAGIKEKRPDNLMCGYGATYTLMKLSKKLGANAVEILKYSNSGDTAGNKDRVVGYLSAAFVNTASGTNDKITMEQAKTKNPSQKEEDHMLNEQQKKELLDIARSTIKYYLETGKKLEPNISDPLLKENMGAFVTLHKNGNLRGCIGHMAATEPLYETVRDMAIAASTHDPRFTPLKINELNEVDLEISVLTPMSKVESYKDINIPGDGVMVQKGFRSGVYLPQVANETGWTREEFMNSLCSHKAGIPINDWKTGKCDIYIFSAEVFGEDKPREKN